LHSDPSGFSKLTCGQQFLQLGPKFEKIFMKRSLASEKSSKIAPKIRIFSTTTPNPVILVPKFLESLPLSFYALI
jgi:hypothetical protein